MINSMRWRFEHVIVHVRCTSPTSALASFAGIQPVITQHSGVGLSGEHLHIIKKRRSKS